MNLSGMKIAILVENGVEKSELVEPKKALEKTGAEVNIVSPQTSKIKSWSKDDWAETFPVDIKLDEAEPNQFDALVLPGGVINPDSLRANEKAIGFIKHFVKNNKPIAAICHGPWTLINAEGVKGHKMTSWSSIKTDLINAGANWIDEEVVVDGNLITSRKPEDLPAFNAKIIEVFSKCKK